MKGSGVRVPASALKKSESNYFDREQALADLGLASESDSP
jgi:hypothetical protein